MTKLLPKFSCAALLALTLASQNADATLITDLTNYSHDTYHLDPANPAGTKGLAALHQLDDFGNPIAYPADASNPVMYEGDYVSTWGLLSVNVGGDIVTAICLDILGNGPYAAGSAGYQADIYGYADIIGGAGKFADGDDSNNPIGVTDTQKYNMTGWLFDQALDLFSDDIYASENTNGVSALEHIAIQEAIWAIMTPDPGLSFLPIDINAPSVNNWYTQALLHGDYQWDGFGVVGASGSYQELIYKLPGTTTIPEPASGFLIVSCLGLLALVRRKA